MLCYGNSCILTSCNMTVSNILHILGKALVDCLVTVILHLSALLNGTRVLFCMLKIAILNLVYFYSDDQLGKLEWFG
jgi:hypothetical protein